MTQDDIIRMAQEAGFEIDCCSLEWHSRIKRFFHAAFAAGAAAEQKKWEDQTQVEINEAIIDEREACAKVCEERKLKYEERAAEPEEFRDINPEVARIAGMTCEFIASEIRARGLK